MGPGPRGVVLLIAGGGLVIVLTFLLATLVVPTEPPTLSVEGVELRPNQVLLLGTEDPDGPLGEQPLSRDLVFSRVRASAMPPGTSGYFSADWVGSAGQTMQITGEVTAGAQARTGAGLTVVLSFDGLTFISNDGECWLEPSTVSPEVEGILRCEGLDSVDGTATIEALGRVRVGGT